MKIVFAFILIFLVSLPSFSQDDLYGKGLERSDILHAVYNTAIYKLKDTTSQVLVAIPKGGDVMFLGKEKGGWFAVRHGNNVGYTPANSLTIETLPIDPETGRYHWSEVARINDVSQSVLYNTSKQWFVDTFKNANAVIQMQDKDEGIIIGKGIISVEQDPGTSFTFLISLKFTCKIQSKDGRYKVDMYDFIYMQPNSTNEIPLEVYLVKNKKKTWSPRVNEDVKKLIASLNAYMTKASTKKEDW